MARQPRIEFAGAFYHVLCRGNRGERIFEGDEDRHMFLRTLAECCEKCGWRVFAWVLMGNHYHLVVHTPEANLVAGMKWFQNTYTRRFNTRHGKAGHLFGGRYKAIVVQREGGGYLEALMDYVHLNPARAGLADAREGRGLAGYPWSSLARGYAVAPGQRPEWLEVVEGLELFGFKDTVAGRRGFVDRLEKRAAEDAGRVAGTAGGLRNTLQRGWYWGSQSFRQEMLKLVPSVLCNRNYRSSGPAKGKDRQEAEFWIERAREHFGVAGQSMAEAPRMARLAAAWALHHRTTQPQAWIAGQLGLRSAANVSQQVRRIDSPKPPAFAQSEEWRRWGGICQELLTDPFGGGGNMRVTEDGTGRGVPVLASTTAQWVWPRTRSVESEGRTNS